MISFRDTLAAGLPSPPAASPSPSWEYEYSDSVEAASRSAATLPFPIAFVLEILARGRSSARARREPTAHSVPAGPGDRATCPPPPSTGYGFPTLPHEFSTGSSADRGWSPLTTVWSDPSRPPAVGAAAPQHRQWLPPPLAAPSQVSQGEHEEAQGSAEVFRRLPGDLKVLSTAVCAEVGRRRAAAAEEFGLPFLPPLLGLCEAIAEELLRRGRVDRGDGHLLYPPIPADQHADLLATATAKYRTLQEELGVSAALLELYSEQPGVEELRVRGRWPVFQYKARVEEAGGRGCLVPHSFEADVNHLRQRPGSRAAASLADDYSRRTLHATTKRCWVCCSCSHTVEQCKDTRAKAVPRSRRALLHFFGARDRFLVVVGVDRHPEDTAQGAAAPATEGLLQPQHGLLGRRYEYLMDKDFSPVTLRYFAPAA